MTYKKNFLTNVIFRLDYDHIKELDKQESPAISKILENNFPNQKCENEKQLEVLVSDKGHSVNQEFSFIWKFISSDKKKIVQITPRYLTLEYLENTYKNFEDLQSDIKKIYTGFLELYSSSINKVNRLGLRYVNQIILKEGNPFDWSGYIKNELITAVKPKFMSNVNLQRSMHQLRARQDDISILFTYGMFNSEFPNPIAKKEFLLDIDCFFMGDINSDLLSVTKNNSELNKLATTIFENSIEDKLKNILSEDS